MRASSPTSSASTNLLVGERTAEQIKLEIGSACPQDPETSMEIKGRNLVDGLPKDILIRSEEVREAMNECLLRIVDAIKDTLECTPPELSSDIIDKGITLSGGGALLRGLDTLIPERDRHRSAHRRIAAGLRGAGRGGGARPPRAGRATA